MEFLKEVTEWDDPIPNHIYAFENKQCVGYIKQGTDELVMFKNPLKQFSKTRRKFKKVKLDL